MQPLQTIFHRALAIAILLILVVACAPAPSTMITPTDVAPADSQPTQQAQDNRTTYPLEIQNGDHTLVFAQAPERAVSLNLHTTELMLALGLGEKLVGTAYGNAQILPEFEAEYQSIPILAEQYPPLEVLVATEADFTYGRSSAYGENGVASVDQLAELGIQGYTVQGTLVEAGTMEDVYIDIRNLGQIFDIQPRAEALIAEMQAEIAAVQAQLADVDEPVKVLVYDAGTDDLFTAGQSLQTHLIELAGGENVFADIEANWTTVSWEEAVARDPDVIVINDYGSVALEDKLSFLRDNPALSSLSAVQNDRFVAIPLPSVFEGVRNPDAVQTLAAGFYPTIFDDTDGTATSTGEEAAFPITVENCGLATTYTEAPTRAVTMNQAATEIMLALGLEGSMIGTAYLDDDTVLPQWQAAYASVPVLSDEYPSQEVLLGVEPDFVYGVYRSAFGDTAAGPRTQLAELGIHSYLSVASCEDEALRPDKVTFDTLFDEILTIGRIFGVEDRAQAVVAEMQSSLADVQTTIGGEPEAISVLWYDSDADAPFVGSCCGAPAMMLEAVGATNIFAEVPGTWATVTWEEAIARNPYAIVLADAEWSTAQEKIDLLLNDPKFASIDAVQNQRFVTIPFGATTLGVRNVEGVATLAKGLYPAKFE